MMEAVCQFCGGPFVAKRSAAKYCGDTCRKRAQRAPLASNRPDSAESEGKPEIPIGLVASTLTELAKAGRENSPAGQAALLLAYRLERGASADTGSAVAALVKQHGATLAEALKGAQKASVVDELKARRDAKRTG